MISLSVRFVIPVSLARLVDSQVSSLNLKLPRTVQIAVSTYANYFATFLYGNLSLHFLPRQHQDIFFYRNFGVLCQTPLPVHHDN